MSDMRGHNAARTGSGEVGFQRRTTATPDCDDLGMSDDHGEDWERQAWAEQGFDLSVAEQWRSEVHTFSAAEVRRLVDAGVLPDEAERYAGAGVRNVSALIAWATHFGGIEGDAEEAGRLIAEGSPGPRRSRGEYPLGVRRMVRHLSELRTGDAPSPTLGSSSVTARRWDGRKALVRCYVQPGLPMFDVDRLSDAEVRAVRDRVRAAILNAGFTWPSGRIIVDSRTVTPDEMRDVIDTRCDTAIAVAVLRASNQIPNDREFGEEFWGELGLDGRVVDADG